MPLGLQGHVAHRQAQVVQHAQLRQPGQGRPPSRPPPCRQRLDKFARPRLGVGVESSPGGVSERFKVRLSKSRVAATPPRVRISPPPPRRHPGMTDTTSQETTQCPQCGASIPNAPGWEMWCEACEWNLEGPAKPPEKKSRSEIRAERRAEQLHQEMMAASSDRRRHSAASWLTFVFALLVHLPAVILLV